MKQLFQLFLFALGLPHFVTAQITFLDPCANGATFVEQLNVDNDFDVTLVTGCTSQPGFVVIYDPLTDSYDAINLRGFDPRSPDETASDFYYNNSGKWIYDLDVLPGFVDPETGDFVPTSYVDRASGLVFSPLETDFISTLLGAGGVQPLARQLPLLALNGAHHRTLMAAAGYEKGLHSWMTGDFGTFNQLDADQVQGEVGVSHDFGINGFRAGMALGYSSVNQDLAFAGDNNIDGAFGIAEVNFQPQDSSLVYSALAYYGSWDADINRGYVTGGAQNFSRGSTDIESFALRLRADWVDLWQLGAGSVTPRLSYTMMHTETDSYTEVGGAFPATFGGQSDLEHLVRLGFDFDLDLNERTQLRTTLEGVTRFGDDPSLQGNILGVGRFNLPGVENKTAWLRAGFELIHEVVENQHLSVSLFGSTEGADPTVSGALGYIVSF